jgi:hypothetical protein
VKMGAAGGTRQGSDEPSGPGSRGLLVIALVLVLLVAGLGAAYSVGLLSGPPTKHSTSQTSTSATTVTSTTTTALSTSSGAPSMPAGCLLAATNSSQGYSVEVFLSNSTELGDNVCLGVVVQNVSGGAPDIGGITQVLNITDSSGRLVDALSTGFNGPTGTLPPGHYIDGSGAWDSDSPYGGITPQAGTYHVSVEITIPQNGQYAEVDLTADANFTLTG